MASHWLKKLSRHVGLLWQLPYRETKSSWAAAEGLQTTLNILANKFPDRPEMFRPGKNQSLFLPLIWQPDNNGGGNSTRPKIPETNPQIVSTRTFIMILEIDRHPSA
jgi:hypothetical protein